MGSIPITRSIIIGSDMVSNSDSRFAAHLAIYLDSSATTVERTRAANAMLLMIAREGYTPTVKLPDDLSEQFHRVQTGSASPTHALEALVGGKAIGQLNMVEGRTGRSR